MAADFRTTPPSDSAGLLSEPAELRARAESDGYLYLRGALERDLVLRVRRSALELCARFGWLADDCDMMEGIARPGIRLGLYDDPLWVQLQCEMLPREDFIALGESEAILSALEAVYAALVQTRRGDICRVFSPRTPELTTVPHQDHFYVGGDTRVWTAWIPLGDCPMELGGIAVLPGSHRLGLLPHTGEGSGRQGALAPQGSVWAVADYRCGDVMLFSCLTLHRACHNVTANRLRLSADFRYQPGTRAANDGG